MSEAAELSGKSISTISRKIKSEELPSERNNLNRILIREDHLQQVYPEIADKLKPAPKKECGSVTMRRELTERIEALELRVTELELNQGSKKKKSSKGKKGKNKKKGKK